MSQIAVEYRFYYDYQTGQLVPWLAAGYDLSDDFMTITVHIREEVTWS